ncbi:MAG: hypothetical protein JXQ90_13370 [Cyclobacteriaceae bacterium]
MKAQYVILLRKQVEKLETDAFDLETWKGGTLSLLIRIFGKDNPRVKLIQELRIDYGSWALRDSNSGYNPKESCKIKGKDVLEGAIDEIELLGLDDNKSNTQFKQLEEIFSPAVIKELTSGADNVKLLSEIFKKEKKEKLATALAILLDNSAV